MYYVYKDYGYESELLIETFTNLNSANALRNKEQRAWGNEAKIEVLAFSDSGEIIDI